MLNAFFESIHSFLMYFSQDCQLFPVNYNGLSASTVCAYVFIGAVTLPTVYLYNCKQLFFHVGSGLCLMLKISVRCVTFVATVCSFWFCMFM